MATFSPCFSLLNSLTVIRKTGDNSRCSCRMNSSNQKPQRTVKFRPVKAKAKKDDQGTVRKTVICSDCDGNGAVLCSQCKGSGVNHVDHFGGQFKAGDSCWLCGGKKDMLCGNCNGAGFLGGFMNSFDTYIFKRMVTRLAGGKNDRHVEIAAGLTSLDAS